MERPIVPPPEPASRTAAAPAEPAADATLSGLEQRLDRLIATRLETAETHRLEGERQARIERFAAAHPDFAQLKAAGVLDALRADNPILDDVGAYLVHSLETERRETAQTVEKARQDAAAAAEAALLERMTFARVCPVAPLPGSDAPLEPGWHEAVAGQPLPGLSAIWAGRDGLYLGRGNGQVGRLTAAVFPEASRAAAVTTANRYRLILQP